jgi:poly(A) polymerase
VGGALRDRLLGRPDIDNDYATDALPDQVEAIGRALGANITTVGKSSAPSASTPAVIGRKSPPSRRLYEGGTRWPEVRFGRTIEEDLARRDFTVNALAEKAFTGEMLDLFGGAEDLERGIIRAVGEPGLRFREDPLRILRGIRFASQLDFAVDPDPEEAMARAVGLLSTLSQERITAELDKLLVGLNPARGLDLLRATGALDIVLLSCHPWTAASKPVPPLRRLGPHNRHRRGHLVRQRPAAPPLGCLLARPRQTRRPPPEGQRGVGFLPPRDGRRRARRGPPRSP